MTRYLHNFLRNDSEKGRLEVHGCFLCLDSGSAKTYPDIMIFHRGEPWVIVELKEQKQVKQLTKEEEREKIRRQRETTKAKRGYLLYVGRWGRHRLRGAKGEFGFWFYEIPITLERSGMPEDKIQEFHQEFKRRSRFVGGSEDE